MKEGFRQAMAWLHTWAGLIFGWLLFAIFLTGTLAYFKDEITHWMQPEVQAHPWTMGAASPWRKATCNSRHPPPRAGSLPCRPAATPAYR